MRVRTTPDGGFFFLGHLVFIMEQVSAATLVFLFPYIELVTGT